VNIYGVLILATAEIQNEIQVISHCNLIYKLNLVKNSFLAYFVSRTILVVIDHMQEHISLTFAFSLTFPWPWPLLNSLTFPGFPGSGHPTNGYIVEIRGMKPHTTGLEVGLPCKAFLWPYVWCHICDI